MPATKFTSNSTQIAAFHLAFAAVVPFVVEDAGTETISETVLAFFATLKEQNV